MYELALSIGREIKTYHFDSKKMVVDTLIALKEKYGIFINGARHFTIDKLLEIVNEPLWYFEIKGEHEGVNISGFCTYPGIINNVNSIVDSIDNSIDFNKIIDGLKR